MPLRTYEGSRRPTAIRTDRNEDAGDQTLR